MKEMEALKVSIESTFCPRTFNRKIIIIYRKLVILEKKAVHILLIDAGEEGGGERVHGFEVL